MHALRAAIPLLRLGALVLAWGCSEGDATTPEDRSERVATAATEAAEPPLARLEYAEEIHDFGLVWEGSQVAHEFELHAAGDTELEILAVRPDCGCTAADLEIVHPDGAREKYVMRTPLAPGTRLALAATFDTRGRPGRTTKLIKIYGNVPGGMRSVGLRARVEPWLETEPATAPLVRMSVLEERVTEFKVSSVEGESFGLSHLRQAVPPELEVELEPVDPGEDGRSALWRVLVTLGPGMPEGARSYPIKLVTDRENPTGAAGQDGRRSPYEALPRVSVFVVGRVSVEPPSISFGIMRADEIQSRTVRVQSHDPDFELPEPEVTLAALDGREEGPPFADTASVTVRPVEGANAWDVELLLDGLSERVERSFLGRMVIETGHPEAPKLEATISGLKKVGTVRNR